MLTQWLRGLMLRAAVRLPQPDLEQALTAVIKNRSNQLAPDEALRFLFRLDNTLYGLQGDFAVKYGAGTHTKHRHMQYHDFFVARIQPDEQVLDIGCGIGAVAYDIAEKSRAHVTGIDIDPRNIEKARARYAHPQVTYIVGNVLKDLPAGQYDVVIFSNVLEHLPDRANFLRHVQTLAQPKRFLIRVPLFERDWRVPLKQELGVESRLDDTHETEYTQVSFAAEMQAAGLHITHLEVHWGEIWSEVRAE